MKAQQKTSSTAGAKRWSDASTWPDKKVPGKDANVTIDRDMNVVLDVTPGLEFKATTERKTMDLHMIEMDVGAWVIVEIPGFAKADSGTSADSLDALHNAKVTSYYKAGDALWVKLVFPGDSGRGGHSGGVMMQVSR